jgi:activator of HSP90 ATPase
MDVQQQRDTATIRQTVIFSASPLEVFETIMDSARHQALSGEKAVISREIGGAFTAWGDHIAGFNLALDPGRKIVQAWRARDWWRDHYSIAIFELRDLGGVAGGTELQFTQIGVPPHRFDGHSQGWIDAYWRPMQDVFARGSPSEQTQSANQAARQRIEAGDL